MRNLLLATLALCASACVTVGAAQPASTMGKGNVQGGVEGNFWGYFVPGRTGVSVLPNVSGFLRFGLGDHVDLGFRAGFNGLELQSKFMFTDPESNFVFSLAAMAQGYFLPQLTDSTSTSTTPNVGTFAVPVSPMVGIKLGNHELVFAAREVTQLYFVRDAYPGAPTQQLLTINLGLSAGIALRLGNSFILMPEIAFQAPVWASVSTPYGTGSAFGTPLVQFTGGVSCIFGKMKPRRDSAPPPVEYVPPDQAAPAEGDSYSPPPLPPDVAPVPPPPPPPGDT